MPQVLTGLWFVCIHIYVSLYMYMYTHVCKALLTVFTTEPRPQVLQIVYTNLIVMARWNEVLFNRQGIIVTRSMLRVWLLQRLKNCGATNCKHSPTAWTLFLLYDKTKEGETSHRAKGGEFFLQFQKAWQFCAADFLDFFYLLPSLGQGLGKTIFAECSKKSE